MQLYKKCMPWMALLASLCAGCKDHYDLPDQPVSSYTQIYMAQAYTSPAIYNLKISDTAQTMVYSANYGGAEAPAQDIDVNFSVDNALVDSFNQANGTSYPVLPEKTYVLGATSAVIPHGSSSTGPLYISVKTGGEGAMDILKDFMLAVRIESANAKINGKLQTAFFKVRAQPNLADYTDYDRSHWNVIGFSSQEASGEGPNNGRAIFCLDGDPNTYWHTQWAGGQPGPPHYITIDMGEVKTLHGLSFLPRQSDNSGKPQNVSVETSLDNVTWTSGGSFTLANNKDLQPQFLSSFRDARYFKVTINTSYNATYTHLAELNAF